VRVARAGGEDGMRLLLGFDGSQGSEDAVEAVASRRWPRGTEARLLAARPETPKSGARGRIDGLPPPKRADDIDRALDAALRRLEAAGLRPSSAVRIGDARRALLDEAMVWNPHAIFLGGRRLQRLRRFLFGSVAGSVADDAPCTVEVVRPR
jgi:nucleotide-binding universal stress UspA family protein